MGILTEKIYKDPRNYSNKSMQWWWELWNIIGQINVKIDSVTCVPLNKILLTYISI